MGEKERKRLLMLPRKILNFFLSLPYNCDGAVENGEDEKPLCFFKKKLYDIPCKSKIWHILDLF